MSSKMLIEMIIWLDSITLFSILCTDDHLKLLGEGLVNEALMDKKLSSQQHPIPRHALPLPSSPRITLSGKYRPREHRIWVTSRTYSKILQSLELVFDVSYKLEPFDCEDQQKFVQKAGRQEWYMTHVSQLAAAHRVPGRGATLQGRNKTCPISQGQRQICRSLGFGRK